MACGNARFVLVGPSKNPSKLHFALDVMADREGLLGTCYGMFLVLATLGSLGGRVRPPRAQNCLSAILSNKGSSTSPQSANKKAPTSGGFFIGGQGVPNTIVPAQPQMFKSVRKSAIKSCTGASFLSRSIPLRSHKTDSLSGNGFGNGVARHAPQAQQRPRPPESEKRKIGRASCRERV